MTCNEDSRITGSGSEGCILIRMRKSEYVTIKRDMDFTDSESGIRWMNTMA